MARARLAYGKDDAVELIVSPAPGGGWLLAGPGRIIARRTSQSRVCTEAAWRAATASAAGLRPHVRLFAPANDA